MKVRRNTKNGREYGNYFIALGGGRREMLDTKDKATANLRMRAFQKTGKWRDGASADPMAAFHAPPPAAPLALLPALETPQPAAPASSSSLPNPPTPQAAPAGDNWVNDFAGAPAGKPPADEDDDLDPEAARELLETAGAVLVEAQLMAQAWLLQRYKGINAAPVDPEHKLRQMGRKAWAKQFKLWWPDFNIPPWAVALGATGMAVLVQVGEGATQVEPPARARAAPSSAPSTSAAPPAEAAAA